MLLKLNKKVLIDAKKCKNFPVKAENFVCLVCTPGSEHENKNREINVRGIETNPRSRGSLTQQGN